MTGALTDYVTNANKPNNGIEVDSSHPKRCRNISYGFHPFPLFIYLKCEHYVWEKCISCLNVYYSCINISGCSCNVYLKNCHFKWRRTNTWQCKLLGLKNKHRRLWLDCPVRFMSQRTDSGFAVCFHFYAAFLL